MADLKFSIITPTHRYSEHLVELFQSLREQSYGNWEWVLYLNGEPDDLSGFSEIKAEFLQDPRVVIFENYDCLSLVGAVKNKAFNLGTGDVLVEVDHDDLLLPNCLEELVKAFADPEVGFVYSDNAVLPENTDFTPYSAEFGWSHRTFEFRGKELYAMRSFPPSSHAFSFIWYAPDHVRAWRTSVYQQLGGHNDEMTICDDHELLLRTYLNSKVHYIPKVLYVYRLHGNNTWLKYQDAIQVCTKSLFRSYARLLAEKDAKDRNLRLIDLGGGMNPLPGYTTYDTRNADVLCDLNKRIPLPDNSVGVVNASHIIEHLKDPIKTMSEIHRVLAHGGWAFIEVPSTDGRGAFQDPTHVSYWNENSFWYYTDAKFAKYLPHQRIRFQEYLLETSWWDEHIAITHAWLVALKPDGCNLPHKISI